jgi:hypothetical protein
MALTQRQRLLLAAPVIVLPFLAIIFAGLGGGKGGKKIKAMSVLGLNTELPAMYMDPKKETIDKLGAYLKAEQDSIRKKQFELRDPYRTAAPDSVTRRVRPAIRTDPKADALLQQLDRLRTSLASPSPVVASPRPVVRVAPRLREVDTPVADPQLDRLNSMLDKVIRIQHPEESKRREVDAGSAEEVLPADSGSNVITAVVPSNETLVTGGTIPLRLAEDIRIHGVVVPRGQWVYGTVTINGDRTLVHVRSLRAGRNLYSIDLQVYDLDGLPGIYIPGMLSRDVAKESADEGVNGLNVLPYSSSLGASAAEAGVQAAKTFIGRKVRLVRVSVRAGYQVLLRNKQDKVDNVINQAVASSSLKPPGFDPGGSFLSRCREEGMEFGVEGIYLQDSVLWFATRWVNHSPIGYQPEYCRWIVRDRRVLKRTAQQEEVLEAVYAPKPILVAGDSVVVQWTGFRAFAPGRDKELLIEVGERNGGRAMTVVVGHKEILRAKKIEP